MRKTAISYRRFSSKPQELGSSIDRQEGDAQGYCDRKGWKLDSTLTDPGLSGFDGKHLKDGELGRFVVAVEANPDQYKGKVLLVEDLSRLSRLGIRKTLALVERILMAGVDIATINPEMYLDKTDLDDMPKMMQLVVYADMYYKQSLDKSRYAKSSWQKKWDKAAHTPVSAKGVSWLRLIDGKWHPIPEIVKTIRRLFALTIDGLGVEAICRQLTKEGVPALGTNRQGGKSTWQKGTVLRILNGRAVLGEYETGARSKQDKAPRQIIANYYPAIIDETTWNKAQASIRGRAKRCYGPVPHSVNPLQGLCKDKASNSTCFTVSKPQRDKTTRKELVPSAAIQGQAKYWSVPLQHVLDAVILAVQELKVVKGIPTQDDPLDALQAKLGVLEAKIKTTIAMVEQTPDIQSLLVVLQNLEREKTTTQDQIKTIKADRTTTLSESQAHIQSAWLALREATDKQPLLMTIRQKLRALVDRVELAKKDDMVSGCIHYKSGQTQQFEINLQAVKSKKGHEIVVMSST